MTAYEASGEGSDSKASIDGASECLLSKPRTEGWPQASDGSSDESALQRLSNRMRIVKDCKDVLLWSPADGCLSSNWDSHELPYHVSLDLTPGNCCFH